MASCILYQDAEKTVTVLDIPRSIELAQGSSNAIDRRRLVSSKPAEQPYPSVEPKSAKAKANVGSLSIEDLLLGKYIQFALADVKSVYKGPWYYPRIVEDGLSIDSGRRCQIHEVAKEGPCHEQPHVRLVPCDAMDAENPHIQAHEHGAVCHNIGAIQRNVQTGPSASIAYVPSFSTYLQGTIAETLSSFSSSAPKFDLVIMDPPWPNRSARRKNSYELSYNTQELRSLLSLIPLHGHLVDNALVGIWVTNKPAFRDLLLRTDGFFNQWGLEVVEEWAWLKVTGSGDPVCALESSWRKPYEILFLGRRRVTGARKTADLKRRIIMAVPDMHSRKPNLRELLEPMLPSKYNALEVFSRNLTAGWWAWGNEVLKFQGAEHWIESYSEA